MEAPKDRGRARASPLLPLRCAPPRRSRSPPPSPLRRCACPRPGLTLPRILLRRRRRRQRRGWAARARPGAARAPPLAPAPAPAAAPAPQPPALRGQRRRRAIRSPRLGRVSDRARRPRPEKHLPCIPLAPAPAHPGAAPGLSAGGAGPRGRLRAPALPPPRGNGGSRPGPLRPCGRSAGQPGCPRRSAGMRATGLPPCCPSRAPLPVPRGFSHGHPGSAAPSRGQEIPEPPEPAPPGAGAARRGGSALTFARDHLEVGREDPARQNWRLPRSGPGGRRWRVPVTLPEPPGDAKRGPSRGARGRLRAGLSAQMDFSNTPSTGIIK